MQIDRFEERFGGPHLCVHGRRDATMRLFPPRLRVILGDTRDNQTGKRNTVLDHLRMALFDYQN